MDKVDVAYMMAAKRMRSRNKIIKAIDDWAEKVRTLYAKQPTVDLDRADREYDQMRDNTSSFGLYQDIKDGEIENPFLDQCSVEY